MAQHKCSFSWPMRFVLIALVCVSMCYMCRLTKRSVRQVLCYKNRFNHWIPKSLRIFNAVLKAHNQTIVKEKCMFFRIAREKFSKSIPLECIQEIENTKKTEDVWLTALNYHYLQQCLVSNMLDHSKNVAAELYENRHLCFCVFGPLVFIGCNSGEIEVYNPEESTQPVLKIKVKDSPIFQLEVLTKKNLLLAKTGRNDLEFYFLPYYSGNFWVYKMTHLKPNFQNFSGELHCERNISICGSLFATATDVHQVCIFQVLAVTKKTVDLKCLTNYIADEAVGCISLWHDEAIVLFKSGEILRWCLSNQVSFVTDRYHEIHYENPVWIFRGRIFCSTIISSQLLGYWRLDRGAEYWLLGKPSCDLVRCRDLGTMFSADTGIEDVLCVCLKQRLLACGTRDGKILLYYLSDTFFSSGDFNINGNNHLTKEFNRVPDLTIRTKERPIRNIQIQFNENNIKIFTWPYMVSCGPGSKGIIQCVVLKEGDWVEQSDRDAIDV